MKVYVLQEYVLAIDQQPEVPFGDPLVFKSAKARQKYMDTTDNVSYGSWHTFAGTDLLG